MQCQWRPGGGGGGDAVSNGGDDAVDAMAW